MTMWHEEYRGYQISYQHGDRFALILPPGREEPLNQRAETLPGEARMELRQKAHAIIDADVSVNPALHANDRP